MNLMDDEGSSPHVRGALSYPSPCTRPRGIIPACAGSTHCLKEAGFDTGDHPRMCGEHTARFRHGVNDFGSSPHVRGAHHRRTVPAPRPGIIPACAGSTKLTFSKPCATRDHPRMCGEHDCGASIQSTARGSSPHVRGALTISKWKHRPVGIIPACAGSTGRYLPVYRCTRDHPRMCGEHVTAYPLRPL